MFESSNELINNNGNETRWMNKRSKMMIKMTFSLKFLTIFDQRSENVFKFMVISIEGLLPIYCSFLTFDISLIVWCSPAFLDARHKRKKQTTKNRKEKTREKRKMSRNNVELYDECQAKQTDSEFINTPDIT